MSADPYDEVLKTAEASLRDTVSRLGNSHPETYAMLKQYIALLRQCGRTEQADKLDVRAQALKDILDREQAEKARAKAEEEAKEAARKAEEEAKAASAALEAAKAQEEAVKAAKAAEKAQEEALAKAVMAMQSPQQTEADKKSELAKKAQKAKAAAEEGVFDLDMFEDDDEESLALALELVKETPELAAPKAAEPVAEPVKQAASDEPVFLFNSHGEHIAVACDKALFSPQGENIGRLLEDYDVYLDRNGWYLGQIVDGNRLARDEAWIHRHLNFGDRGNEGDRAGWGRIADVERTYFDRGFEDVKLGSE